MSFTVTISRRLRATQGLPSPVRRAHGLSPLAAVGETTLEVEIRFSDEQIGEHGWFVDTDAVDLLLEGVVVHLSSKPWTQLFEFRPTLELVARWIHQQLTVHLDQLSCVRLSNVTLGVSATYTGADA